MANSVEERPEVTLPHWLGLDDHGRPVVGSVWWYEDSERKFEARVESLATATTVKCARKSGTYFQGTLEKFQLGKLYSLISIPDGHQPPALCACEGLDPKTGRVLIGTRWLVTEGQTPDGVPTGLYRVRAVEQGRCTMDLYQPAMAPGWHVQGYVWGRLELLQLARLIALPSEVVRDLAAAVTIEPNGLPKLVKLPRANPQVIEWGMREAEGQGDFDTARAYAKDARDAHIIDALLTREETAIEQRRVVRKDWLHKQPAGEQAAWAMKHLQEFTQYTEYSEWLWWEVA